MLATPQGELLVVAPRPPSLDGSGFARALELARVSLRPSGPDVVAGGHRAVALAAGSLDPPPSDGAFVRAPRKAALAVLTEAWRVIVFDHNLAPVWEVALAGVGGLPERAAVREAALLISHRPLKDGDRGSIFVMASAMRVGETGDGAADGAAADKEERAAAHGGAQAGAATSRDAHAALYVALAGGSGEVRWTAGGEEEQGGGGGGRAAPLPQHDFRVTPGAAAAAAAARARPDCADFREAVLDTLPHAWAGARAGARLRPAHFWHSAKAAPSSVARQARRPGAAQRAHPALEAAAAGAGGRAAGRANAVSRAAARAAARAARGGAAGAAASTAPRATGGRTDADAARAWAHAHAPNVVVALSETGLDARHLYSGARVCRLRLPSPGLSADVDGDGVLDYVVAVSSHGGGGGAGGAAHAHARACTGVALAGVPPIEPLWNVSLCGRHGADEGDGDDGGDSFFGGARHSGPVEAAPPALLRTRDAAGRRTRAHSLIAFLTSRGDVAAVRQDGSRAWRARAGARWAPHPPGSPHPPPAPTLAAFALRPHTRAAAFLAAGDERVSLVSATGHVLASAPLPAPPTLPALAVDADGDGLTDVIVVTAGGVFGFAQTRPRGAAGGAALAAVVAVAFVAVWATAGGGASGDGRKARRRATERDD